MIRTCPLTGANPTIDPTAYVDRSAEVVGNVTLGPRSSVWLGCVLRGDVNTIEIGAECNIQDRSVLHVTKNLFGLRLGHRVSIAHSVTLHGCAIEDGALIGIGAIVMDGVEIGSGSLVAAGSLVTPGKRIPPGSLVMGSPARVKRPVNSSERELIERTWQNYVAYAEAYRASLTKASSK